MGCHFLLQPDLSNPGTELPSPASPAWAGRFFTSGTPGKLHVLSVVVIVHVWLFVTPWTAARQTPLSFTVSWNFLKLMPVESVMLSNHLICCCLLRLLPSIFSRLRVFSNELALSIRWSKHWSFSFSISPSNEYSGLISFRIDCCYILCIYSLFFIYFSQQSSNV